MRGGRTKVAIIASSLMGMVSGSHVANVVTTGTMTIPMMIKGGYARTFAAAVEGCCLYRWADYASCNEGVAFIIPEILGFPTMCSRQRFCLPYCIILPVLLLLTCGLPSRGLRIKEKMPSLKEVLREDGIC